MAWPSSDKVRNGMAKFGQGKEWHGQIQDGMAKIREELGKV